MINGINSLIKFYHFFIKKNFVQLFHKFKFSTSIILLTNN